MFHVSPFKPYNVLNDFYLFTLFLQQNFPMSLPPPEHFLHCIRFWRHFPPAALTCWLLCFSFFLICHHQGSAGSPMHWDLRLHFPFWPPPLNWSPRGRLVLLNLEMGQMSSILLFSLKLVCWQVALPVNPHVCWHLLHPGLLLIFSWLF